MAAIQTPRLRIGRMSMPISLVALVSSVTKSTDSKPRTVGLVTLDPGPSWHNATPLGCPQGQDSLLSVEYLLRGALLGIHEAPQPNRGVVS